MRRIVSLSIVVIALAAAGGWYFSPQARDWVEKNLTTATVPAKAVDYPDTDAAVERVERLWAERG